MPREQRKRSKSHEAFVCGHCGKKDRMFIIAAVDDLKEFGDDHGLSYEAGTKYQIQECPNCHKIVLIAGHWHDGIEDVEDWMPEVLLPDVDGCAARKVYQQQKLDSECMQLAVSLARKCISEKGEKPKVAAVVTCNG